MHNSGRSRQKRSGVNGENERFACACNEPRDDFEIVELTVHAKAVRGSPSQ
jgi:hypothetical protein